MSYHVVRRWGDSEERPNENRMREVLSELDRSDAEHPDTWLTHESGWTLSVFESGLVVWENPETEDQPRHQVNVSREKALELWLKLARGEIAAIEREPWRPGQSPPLNDEDRAELARKAEEATMASFKSFYDQLGAERPDVPCRDPSCKRGAVRYSAFCRVHHFEMIYHRECPFEH